MHTRDIPSLRQRSQAEATGRPRKRANGLSTSTVWQRGSATRCIRVSRRGVVSTLHGWADAETRDRPLRWPNLATANYLINSELNVPGFGSSPQPISRRSSRNYLQYTSRALPPLSFRATMNRAHARTFNAATACPALLASVITSGAHAAHHPRARMFAYELSEALRRAIDPGQVSYIWRA